MKEHSRRVNLVGPTILIIVGIVLLLNNLGWAAISVWDLVRLWPVLLIAGGLELLIGQRSRLGSVLVLIAMLAMLAGGLWLLSTWRPEAPVDGEEIRASLNSATSAEVDIGFSVGTLRVQSMTESENLVQGSVELYRGERLEQAAQMDGSKAYVALRSMGYWSVPFLGWEGDKPWDLQINRDVPIELKVSAGVGDVSLDLKRADLSGLDLNLGVGRAVVILPERGHYEANVEGGVGELIVKVPEGIGIRVDSSMGLGNVSLPSSYQRQGDVHTSPGYDRAESRVDLVVQAGVGRVVVQEYVGE